MGTPDAGPTGAGVPGVVDMSGSGIPPTVDPQPEPRRRRYQTWFGVRPCFRRLRLCSGRHRCLCCRLGQGERSLGNRRLCALSSCDLRWARGGSVWRCLVLLVYQRYRAELADKYDYLLTERGFSTFARVPSAIPLRYPVVVTARDALLDAARSAPKKRLNVTSEPTRLWRRPNALFN